MRMVNQILPLGVQQRDESDRDSKVPGIRSDRLQCFDRCLEQDAVSSGMQWERSLAER